MRPPRWRTAVATIALLALAACGFTPMPVPDPSALPPGPGLVTGKTGEFTIFARP